MLKQRVVTASVITILFLSVLLLAPALAFIAFMSLVIILGAWEWANLAGLNTLVQRAIYVVAVVGLGAAMWVAVYHFQWLTPEHVLGLSGVWWAIALLWVQGYPASAVLWRTVPVRLLMGLCVLLPAWLAVYQLRVLADDPYLVLAVVLLVAAADSGAYFFGRAFGRHKLAPNVSPGKSWEGVLGGMAVVLVIAGGYSLVSGQVTLIQAFVIAVPTALVSVLGDLLESMLKRQRGIKDSSQLLPGHGGVLDRIDGLVAAVPVFTLVLLLTQ